MVSKRARVNFNATSTFELFEYSLIALIINMVIASKVVNQFENAYIEFHIDCRLEALQKLI